MTLEIALVSRLVAVWKGFSSRLIKIRVNSPEGGRGAEGLPSTRFLTMGDKGLVEMARGKPSVSRDLDDEFGGEVITFNGELVRGDVGVGV